MWLSSFAAGTQERVKSLALDESKRHLYALTEIDGNIMIVSLLVYAVVRVWAMHRGGLEGQGCA